jgi:mannose-6-phosphate isomerase
MDKVLFLQGKFVEKIWGGDGLKEFGYKIPSEKIGEYRAISAMEGLSSKVLNGTFKGLGLDKIYKENRELFGKETEETFPLLVKLIDAKEDLSIQVHPDDLMAEEEENSRGKTECRYILNENPSSIVYGLNTDDKNKAIDLIDQKKWEELLKVIPAKKDDFFYVPAGKVHAIKKGCLILEIQQASDITYRLYDYDRKDDQGQKRELHLEKSKKAIKTEPVTNEVTTKDLKGYKLTKLIENKYFEVKKYEVEKEAELSKNEGYLLEAVIEGAGKLIIENEEYPIKKGDFFVLTSFAKDYKFQGRLKIIETRAK